MNDNPQGYDHDEVRKPIWKKKSNEEHKVYLTYLDVKALYQV